MSDKLVCGDLVCFFGSKVWHSTDKYRRIVWQCNGKYHGDVKCRTPYLTDDLWYGLGESIMIKDKTTAVVKFKNGLEIPVCIKK